MGIQGLLTCILRNLYAGQEATVRTGHGRTGWYKIEKGVRQGWMLSPVLFNSQVEWKVESLSRVRLFATPWTVAHQAPLSMGFSKQEYWSGLPFPSLGNLPNPGIEPRSPVLQADALPSELPRKSCTCRVHHVRCWAGWLLRIKIARRTINNLRYADGTTLRAESEEELKSLFDEG